MPRASLSLGLLEEKGLGIARDGDIARVLRTLKDTKEAAQVFGEKIKTKNNKKRVFGERGVAQNMRGLEKFSSLERTV